MTNPYFLERSLLRRPSHYAAEPFSLVLGRRCRCPRADPAAGRIGSLRAVVLVIGLLVIGVACAIAAWFVIREAGRLAAEPPPPVFDMDEAFEWVVEHLPDLVAATLTADDVRRILDFQLEFFQRQGVTGNGSSAHPPGDVVVGGAETVDYIVSRSAATGEEYLPEQVHAVVETQLAYLRAIGAVGDAAAARPDDGPRVPDGTRRPARARAGRPGSATKYGPEKGGGPADAR